MKFVLAFAFCALILTGCKTAGKNFAGYLATSLVLDPVFDATVEGGKAAYMAIEEYWVELNREDGEPLE